MAKKHLCSVSALISRSAPETPQTMGKNAKPPIPVHDSSGRNVGTVTRMRTDRGNVYAHVKLNRLGRKIVKQIQPSVSVGCTRQQA
jgi:hypothetical protein